MSSALSSILLVSWSHGNRASLRAMRNRARVPSRRTRSAPSGGTMRVRYVLANRRRASTLAGGHPVRSRSAPSSERPIGCAGKGRNIFACSAESQSRSGAAREAVLTTRKDGCATEISELSVCGRFSVRETREWTFRRNAPAPARLRETRRCACPPKVQPLYLGAAARLSLQSDRERRVPKNARVVRPRHLEPVGYVRRARFILSMSDRHYGEGRAHLGSQLVAPPSPTTRLMSNSRPPSSLYTCTTSRT